MPVAEDLDTTTEPSQVSLQQVHRGWVLRTVFLVLVGALLVVACFDFLGYRSRTLRHESNGLTSEVTYGQLTRRGITTPLRIDVQSPDGFEGDVVLRLDGGYLERLDVRRVTPQPDKETVIGGDVEWTFSQPSGQEFTVAVDAEIDASAIPGWVDGTLDVGVGHQPVDRFTFRTWIYP